MIVLDTNVISELMREAPQAFVVRWLDKQPPESIWTTSITVFEIRYGLQVLKPGKRRRFLESAFEQTLDTDFGARILDFDRTAAEASANISSQLHNAGRPIDIRDVQIAGIVAARRGTLATRNSKHFRNTGVKLVDPWETTKKYSA